MDVGKIQKNISNYIKKYKFAAIVLLVGIIFILIPTGKRKETPSIVTVQEETENIQIQQSLEQILSQISGAGEVSVLLSVSSGEETVYQTNNKHSGSEENRSTQYDTVTVTDADRNQTGLIKQTISPVYRGAIVVCEGADSAMVRLAIVEAVSNITGLSSDRISVLKMK